MTTAALRDESTPFDPSAYRNYRQRWATGMDDEHDPREVAENTARILARYARRQRGRARALLHCHAPTPRRHGRPRGR